MTRMTGAAIARRALERIGVTHTFGIPGVHNTELYDELASSPTITPVLVTHEGGASFMADAVSRVSGRIGTLVIVPAAGVTHAASGIGEAFLAGVPMLILCGGIRSNLAKRYQLHDVDQHALLRPITKATFKVARPEDVAATIYEAHRIATSGEPGPVFVELPVNVQLELGEDQAEPAQPIAPPAPGAADIERAAELLVSAKRPGLFLGWGARDGTAEAIAIAEYLQAPVATTLQGLSVFPADHPLHAGFCFGPSAVPASRNAFEGCDAMLAVGTRFAEIATGSFGAPVPATLVHVDINPDVFGANYPAAVALAGDARAVLARLLATFSARGAPRALAEGPAAQIKSDKASYRDEWLRHDSAGRVNPARFFLALRAAMPRDAIGVMDDGNHTFLTAELFPVYTSGAFIMPTDFNCMGYAVPAAIGAKLARPEREVFTIVGDGAFSMTCMEIVTAVRQGLGLVYYVFHDGELSQIAQAQAVPYNRKPCTTIGDVDLEGLARATGAAYLDMPDDAAVGGTIAAARALAAAGRAVIVDVRIDYSKASVFTAGTMKTNFMRFPLGMRLRFATRALKRRVFR
jgi:acetolactate synthase I/II/III large subunit